MRKTEVETIRPNEFDTPWFFEEIERIMQAIRTRADEMFQSRSLAELRETGGLFSAEQQMFLHPPSELIEQGPEFRLRIAAPGFQADQLLVAVEPDCITVRGEIRSSGEQRDEEVIFSELRDRELFRRFPLAHPVDPGLVTATLEDGVLTVTLPKAAIALIQQGDESPVQLLAKAATTA
jgi:HSP20 family protein